MKYFFWLIFIAACFPLGWKFHEVAGLRDLSLGESGSIDGKQRVVLSQGGMEVEFWIDPATIREDELPETVELKKRMMLSAEDGISPVTLEQGSMVKVLDKIGSNLTVSALSGPLKGIIPVGDTDLLEKVVKSRAGQLAAVNPPIEESTDPEPTETEPVPEPPAVAKNEEPAGEKPPMDDEAPAEENSEASEDGGDIVKLMQDSITSGEVTEFTFDQVDEWKVGADEEVDGQMYQVGIAAYQAETIFGVKTVEAKALVKDGKVEKWVYAKTGMEIR